MINNGVDPKDIIIIDDLSNGDEMFAPAHCPFYPYNISSSRVVGNIFKKHKIDTVIHFAASIEVGKSILHPKEFHINNFINTYNLLYTMGWYGVKRFVYSSSAAVYGIPASSPIKENTPLAPINPYGQTKLDVEKRLPNIEEMFGIKFIALRYFNAAGAMEDGSIGEAHKDESHVIPLMMKATMMNPFKIFGTDYKTPDGTCVRDYVHVLDLARAHIAAANYLEEGGESNIFNVGTGKGTSVKELLAKASQAMEREIPCVVGDRRLGDPPELVADVQKIRDVLEWKAKYNVDDIMKHAWGWHKQWQQ